MARVRRSLNEPGRFGMRREGVPARILDHLEFDRGWLTIAGIAEDLELEEDTVSRSLYRMLPLGRVEKRKVGLAGIPRRGNPGGVLYRIEWRATFKEEE